jgi:hypothetical protein
MAVTNIDLSDPISTLVTKTNTISASVGDIGTLGTTATSSLVAAINEINTKIVAIDTDQEVSEKVEAYFNTTASFDIQNMSADSATFTNITVNGEAQLDSARFTNFALKSNSGASSGTTIGNLSFAKPLQIKNSSGTVLLAGYIVSTDSDNGTI